VHNSIKFYFACDKVIVISTIQQIKTNATLTFPVID